MTLGRYLLVRTGWAAGMLFAVVSVAYLVVWVAGDYRREPGYGSFLWGLLQGSLGHTTFGPPGTQQSVDSLVWSASKVTVSLLFVTAVFTLVVAVALALLARHGRAARGTVRSFEFLGVSLLPTWTGLLILGYLAAPDCSTRPATARSSRPCRALRAPVPRPGRVARAPRLAGGHADDLLRGDLLTDPASRPRAGRARAASKDRSWGGRGARAARRPAVLRRVLREADCT